MKNKSIQELTNDELEMLHQTTKGRLANPDAYGLSEQFVATLVHAEYLQRKLQQTEKFDYQDLSERQKTAGQTKTDKATERYLELRDAIIKIKSVLHNLLEVAPPFRA